MTLDGSGGFEGFEASAPEHFCYSPQVVAKAQSVKLAQSDQRSVLLRSVQDQPVSQAQFTVLVSQGQGQGLGRPVVVRRDDIDSLFNEEEFSIDLIRQ